MKPLTEISIPGAEKTLEQHRRIYNVLSRNVPAALLKEVQFCRIENSVLRVTVNNAAALAKLRYSTGQIIDDLSADGFDVSNINWHVSRESALPATRKKVKPAPTGEQPASASLLQSTAQDMPDDELKKALLKMAKHLG